MAKKKVKETPKEELKEEEIKVEEKKEVEEKVEVKEDKKEKLSTIKIIIIIVVGLLCLTGSFLISYNATKDVKVVEDKEDKKEKKKDKDTKEEYLKVGKYKLQYGTYKGTEEEYDSDKEKTIKTEVKVELTKDKMIVNGNSMNYKVKDDNYIYINEVKMYEVTANNKFTLIAGAGIDFELVK